VLALDGIRLTDDPNKALANRPTGSDIKLLVVRDGQIQELAFPLLASAAQRYRVQKLPNATAEQQQVLAKWLRLTQ
jgi:predicted metalloprotease with PDZ domain